jgi:diaminopimelate decarboxylase
MGEARSEWNGELYYGSQTCDESDLLRLSLGDSHSLAVGDYLLLAGLNGYSAAWNHGFNGIVTPIHLID